MLYSVHAVAAATSWTLPLPVEQLLAWVYQRCELESDVGVVLAYVTETMTPYLNQWSLMETERRTTPLEPVCHRYHTLADHRLPVPTDCNAGNEN